MASVRFNFDKSLQHQDHQSPHISNHALRNQPNPSHSINLTTMKTFTLTALSTLTLPLFILASPTLPDANTSPNSLVKREACTVRIDLGFDKQGTCVDTTKSNPCPNGLLVTGFCGGGNSNICCIKNDCFDVERK